LIWSDTLTPKQKKFASSSLEEHCVLISGPGTGKTYTIVRKVAFLIEEKEISPSDILVISFTRASAIELKKQLQGYFGEGQDIPSASTLHSFAFKQLLANQKLLSDILPTPIQVLDDWKEDKILYEELKILLNTQKQKVKDHFNNLSDGFDTLKCDDPDLEELEETSRFISIWEKHREFYGYLLRSELVYQTIKAVELYDRFEIDIGYKYVIVDEYQDLNRCDQALLNELKKHGDKICAIGDDDQSIYGFRHAFPDGIRNFLTEYSPSSQFLLEICRRCDRSIIALGISIISRDNERIPKELKPSENAGIGETHLYRFDDETDEAKGIAEICRKLIVDEDYLPEDILILLATDKNKKFSNPIKEEIKNLDIEAFNEIDENILNSNNARLVISYLRLISSFDDSIALRTIFEINPNFIAKTSYKKIYEKSLELGCNFFQTVEKVSQDTRLISMVGPRIKNQFDEIKKNVESYQNIFQLDEAEQEIPEFFEKIKMLAEFLIEEVKDRTEILDALNYCIENCKEKNFQDLFSSIYAFKEDQEQYTKDNCVNIISMHKAKGMTRKAIIIACAEDETIPGDPAMNTELDMLRLFYVSITRAMHYLAITYCKERVGNQRFSGINSKSGQKRRRLTRFLKNNPLLRSELGESLYND